MEDNNKSLAPADPKAGAVAVRRFTDEHAREVGMPSPQAVDLMVSTAKLILNSSLITGDMGSTAEQIQANALAKMLVGYELGVSPIQSLQDIDIVKGRIFVRYPQLIAQMMKKGFVLKWVERSEKRAALQVTPPEGYPMEEEIFEFSIEDARRAGLVNTPSKQYELRPRVMLSARVVSEAYRMTGGRSNLYTPEEREEIELNSRPDGSRRQENPFKVGDTGEAPATNGPVVDVKPTEAAPPPPPSPPPPASPKVTEMPKPTAPADKPKQEAPQPEAPKAAAATPAPPVARPPAENPPAATQAPAAAAAAAPAKAPNPLNAMFQRLVEMMPKENPNTLHAKITGFTKGFLGVDRLPKTQDIRVFMIPLRFAEALLRDYPNLFLENPGGAGKQIGASYKQVQARLDEWHFSDDCKDLVFECIVSKHMAHSDSGGLDTVDWLALDELQVDKMTAADAHAFLSVAVRTNKAFHLPALAKAAGKSVHKLVEGWGVDLKTAPVAGIEALLTETVKDPVAPPPAAASPEAPEGGAAGEEEEDDPFNSSLFGDLTPPVKHEYPG